MDSRSRQLVPHILAMIVLYGIALFVATELFELSFFWSALTIAVAILFGYKPAIVAVGLGPEQWVEDIERKTE